MAKSLRSAHKKRTKALKRQHIFGPVEEQRLTRLATAQAAAAQQEKVGGFMDTESKTEEDNTMTDKEPGLVSTGGYRSKKVQKKILKKKAKGKKKPIKF
ncbi:hypothetical protein BDB01DRAFT_808467 [Pilobolus umbonatus]|nr:hypothetical protein BDB01DRAFT_808467 [Pilobolus umbonatus]